MAERIEVPKSWKRWGVIAYAGEKRPRTPAGFRLVAVFEAPFWRGVYRCVCFYVPDDGAEIDSSLGRRLERFVRIRRNREWKERKG